MDILMIAHFITEFKKNGTSRFIFIAENLSDSNNVELVTSTFDHLRKEQRKKCNYDLNTKITLIQEKSYPKNVCLKRFVSHYEFGKNVKNYLESRKKPDVIYCAVPSLDCAYEAARFAAQNNIKFIIDVQDLWPEAFKMVFNIPLISDVMFGPMKAKADYIYSRADEIVGVSDTYCKRALSVNSKVQKANTVFLGTDVVNFDKFASENSVPKESGKIRLAYCGTLGHSYDLKCVFDALNIISANGYKNIEFWVMGDGPLKTSFEKYAAEKDINVVFWGRVPYEKMCGLLTSCDICINPIAKGAAGSIINKHADYAASGLPVINTQECKEYRDLVDTYKFGLNCVCGNAESISEALQYLLDSPEQRNSMGCASRKAADELFDRKKSYLSIFSILK